jgi:YVTN family beta-propeller protein
MRVLKVRRPRQTLRLGVSAEILAFLIADIRGYTHFTETRGDEAGAALATAFAEIVGEGVEARGGRVVELRGDEALAVFRSPRQALRAAVDLQLVLADEVALDPSLPLGVGMGIDAGEAVPVEGGYRGGALNMAARLCSRARAGEILTSPGVLHLTRAVEGLRFVAHGSLDLKGLAEPVLVHAVVAEGQEPHALVDLIEAAVTDGRPRAGRPTRTDVPAALATLTPLYGRNGEARALRWTWRNARREGAHVAVVSGPEGIGKTRLAAEVAALAARDRAPVLYASRVGTHHGARSAIAAARDLDGPALLVLDDLEGVDPSDLEALGDLVAERGRLLVVCAFRDDEAPEAVADALGVLASANGGPIRLRAIDAEAVGAIAGLYVEDPNRVPLSRLVDETAGIPGRVHRAASTWAQDDARRLGRAATATGREDLGAVDEQVATSVGDEGERPSAAAVSPAGAGGRLARVRRRSRWLGAALAAFTAVAAATAALALRDDPPHAAAAPALVVAPNSLVEIDPATNRVASVTHVGKDPESIAMTRDAAWVQTGDRTVVRVDLRTRATRALGGVPFALAVAATLDGDVWVSSFDKPIVTQLVRRGRVVGDEQTAESAPLSVGVPGSAEALAVGGGYLWVTSSNDTGGANTVSRIDLRTQRLVSSVRVGTLPLSLAFGYGSAWVANYRDDSLSVIRPGSEQPDTVPVLGGPLGVATGAGAVWVVSYWRNAVVRIDPETRRVARTIPVGRGPLAVAVGGGAVWVTNRDSKTITRIDPETNKVAATIRLAAAPYGIRFAHGRLWVTTQRSGS